MAKTEKKAKPEQEAKKNAEPQAETPDTETAAAEAEAQAPDTQPDEAAPDARLQELEAQLLQANDKFLRTLAEYDNYRKRSVREKEQAYADSKAAVLTEFLPVLDNFERAQAGTDASYEDYRKGVDMIFSQLAACFESLARRASARSAMCSTRTSTMRLCTTRTSLPGKIRLCRSFPRAIS